MDPNVLGLPGAKKTVGALAAASFLDAVAAVGQSACLAWAVVRLWAGAPPAAIVGWVGGFFVCFVLRRLIVYGRSSLIDRYARERADGLCEALTEQVYEGGPSWVSRRGTGCVVSALVEDMDRIEVYLGFVLPKTVDLVVIPTVLVVALFLFDWVSGLIALTVFPCIVVFMRLLGANAKEAAARQQGVYRRLSSHFIDTMRGMGTLKLFGRTAEYGDRVYRVSEEFRLATNETLRIATLSGLVLDLWGTFALAAVAIMLGFRLLDGSIGFFPALTCLMLVPDFFGAIRRYSTDFHASLDGRVALESLLESIKPNSKGNVECIEHPSSKRAFEVEVDREPPSFVCSNVCFTYPDEDAEAIHNVNFKVNGYGKVAIVGGSGSGKSTLAHLVAGYAAPTCGSFIVGGRELPSLRMPDWERMVSYIPQNPRIFCGTLRDNVAFYRPDSTDEAVTDAIEAAGLSDLLASLPHGIQTRIGEGGRPLSGGQAQRVALARAVLDPDRRVLVFDEPTAHLDIETELVLKERMLRLMEERLVFFATHRLHWVHDMDLVVVLEGGRIVQAGSPEEVCAAPGGPLERLMRAQRGDAG